MNTAPTALRGIRVLDLGIVTAGAASSQILADFGADVIKVESTRYHDPFRDWDQLSGKQSNGSSASSPFNFVNRGKRGVAIDLKSARGREIFLELVAASDVVVENFRRGVLERLGLGFEELKAANPRIVLLSLSSQGGTGPEARHVSFGSTLEALGGLMGITGYGPDEPPVWTGNNVNYPDQIVSILAPGLALAALRARDSSNEAIHIDLAQREAVASVVGDAVLEHSTTGRSPRPRGNRHERFAPQGVYPAEGADRWIAISIQDDSQWERLCTLLDDEELTSPPFTTAEGRRQHQQRLDESIARLTRSSPPAALAERLQELGIPASAVLRPEEVIGHPQLSALNFQQVDAETGVVDRGFVASLSETPGRITRRAPGIGEHTEEVLHEVLGYDHSQLLDLRDSGAVWFDTSDANDS